MKVHQKAKLILCLAILGALPAFASQNVEEVIKMSKGGASRDVLVAYVEKSNGDPSISADDILQMDSAGVPAAAIEAMLAKEKTALALPAANVGGGEEVTVAPSADNADISYFYDSMSHDGTWANDAEYGWSWSPAISVSDNNWRPYVDNGSWVYTDDGWYWNSGYNWGWAAFHYGRWSHRENRWYWHPDNVWGSSWVSWRNNNDHYGWAPLTPRARYGSSGFDVRLTTGNFDLNIGLGERDYAFVRSNHFLERDLNHRQIQRNEVTNIYNNSTVANHYSSNNNRMSNQGIPVRTVALATKQEIKPVTIVDHTAKAGEAVHVGAMQNNRLEVFRPTLAAKASVDPVAAAARRTEAVNKRNTTLNRPAVAGDTAKPDAAFARQAERKAEAVKRVTERASREPQPKPQAAEITRRDPIDAKSVTPPARVPEVVAPRTPTERAPATVPERHDPRAEVTKPNVEVPKVQEPAKNAPAVREERPAKVEPPTREERVKSNTEAPARREPANPEPRVREERPARTDPPARNEKPERPDRNEK